MSHQKFNAVIFDLDGVITKTAAVHSASWKLLFDEYLESKAKKANEEFKEFTTQDYLTYVDGKPRYEGVQSFLKSRNIELDYGDVSDDPDRETVCGLGNKKNVKFKEKIEKDGIEIYESTVSLMKQLKKEGIHVGVASSSKNCKYILEKADLIDLVETRVDGVVSAELGLKGKPQPDIFVRAAENMGVAPAKAVVFEDAVSGVQAGRNGGFALVVGLARENNQNELKENGADVVLEDFGSHTIEDINQWIVQKQS